MSTPTRDALRTVAGKQMADWLLFARDRLGLAGVPLPESVLAIEREAAEAPAASLDVLLLSWAIDEHTQALPASEPVHDEGTCSDDCAGDIKARYERIVREHDDRS